MTPALALALAPLQTDDMGDASVIAITGAPVRVAWRTSTVDVERAAAAIRELERIYAEAKHSPFRWHQTQTIRHVVTPVLRMAGWTDDLLQEDFDTSEHHLLHADVRLGNRFRTEGIVEVKMFGQDIYRSERRERYANPLVRTSCRMSRARSRAVSGVQGEPCRPMV